MSTSAGALTTVGTFRAARIILFKELRAELRTRELLNTTVVFVLMIAAMFSFSLNPSGEEARRIGPGLLWLAVFFASSLMLNPSFAKEQSNDTWYALRLAPVEPFAILLGKAVSNFIFLTLAEWLLLPAFAVFFNIPIGGVFAQLVLVLALGTCGICVSGTVFSALAAQARMRELLLPLLLLPFLTPVLIAGIEATAGLFQESPELQWTPVKILIGFDIVFIAVSYVLFPFLTEE
ncbi:MAG: heme exporter protein CcmB [Acidobacteria bacterium]|nr:heme exporter protein CcmB [Acidobacteriota bacterium]